MAPYAIPTMPVDPSTGEIYSNEDRVFSEITVGVVGNPATQVVPEGEIRNILQIRVEAAMDSNVADRVLSLEVSPLPPLLTVAVAAVIITGPTLSADQEGGINLYQGPSTWLNDNGTITRQADTNPLPQRIRATSTIVADITNPQVGDQMAIETFYTLV
jgi:hypothetical protein